jgi:hypothetical protein
VVVRPPKYPRRQYVIYLARSASSLLITGCKWLSP